MSHGFTIKFNPVNKSIFNAVKSGELTSKVRTVNGKTNVIGRSWVSLTYEIYTLMENTKYIKRHNLCVYRTANIKLKGEGSLDISNRIIQIPIPASCTINLNFAKKWGSVNSCCIFKIHLTPDVLYLPMEKPSVERGDRNQDEVLIPAGELHIDNIYMSDIGRVIEGRLYPYTLDELFKNLD